MKKDLKDKIYRSLKTGGKTIDEIQIDIGKKYSKKDISACMDILLKDGWIERYARQYRLIHVLGAPIDPSNKLKSRDWDYEKIQEAQAVPKRPDEWMNPFLNWIPHCDQGGRGTCCGFAGKYAVISVHKPAQTG